MKRIGVVTLGSIAYNNALKKFKVNMQAPSVPLNFQLMNQAHNINSGVIEYISPSSNKSSVIVRIDKTIIRTMFETLINYRLQHGQKAKYEYPELGSPYNLDDSSIGGSIVVVTDKEVIFDTQRQFFSGINGSKVPLNILEIQKSYNPKSPIKRMLVCVVRGDELTSIRLRAGTTSLVNDMPFYFTFAIKRETTPMPRSLSFRYEEIDDIEEVGKYLFGKKCVGTLQLGSKNNWVYVKIDDKIIFEIDRIFHRSNPNSKCTVPPYFKDSVLGYDAPVGAHISVISTYEMRSDPAYYIDYFSKKVGEKIEFTCESASMVVPHHWEKVAFLWMCNVSSKLLSSWNEKGHHFTFQVKYTPETQAVIDAKQKELALKKNEEELYQQRFEQLSKDSLEQQMIADEKAKERIANNPIMKILETSKTEMQALKQLKGLKILNPEFYQIEKAMNLGWDKVADFLTRILNITGLY